MHNGERCKVTGLDQGTDVRRTYPLTLCDEKGIKIFVTLVPNRTVKDGVRYKKCKLMGEPRRSVCNFFLE